MLDEPGDCVAGTETVETELENKRIEETVIGISLDDPAQMKKFNFLERTVGKIQLVLDGRMGN